MKKDNYSLDVSFANKNGNIMTPSRNRPFVQSGHLQWLCQSNLEGLCLGPIQPVAKQFSCYVYGALIHQKT
jgi:hypothetical protein